MSDAAWLESQSRGILPRTGILMLAVAAQNVVVQSACDCYPASGRQADFTLLHPVFDNSVPRSLLKFLIAAFLRLSQLFEIAMQRYQ